MNLKTKLTNFIGEYVVERAQERFKQKRTEWTGKLVEVLQSYAPKKTQEEVVMSLILNTAALALEKGKHVELAPIKGTCGNIKLSGNSLPTFVYIVFEKKIMEFIEVRVEVSKPDRVQYFSKIVSSDEKANGKSVETKEKYKQPFLKLCDSLTTYFPFPAPGVEKNEPVQVSVEQAEEVI